MPQENVNSLPFLTRRMLDFESSAVFGLKITHIGSTDASVAIRGATKAGPFTYRFNGNNTEATSTENFRLPDIPLWISIIDLDGEISPGNIWVNVELTVNGDPLYALLSGYVDFTQSISWPQTNLETPTKGLLRVGGTVSSDPAAGSEISITVPDSQVWLVRSVSFTLVASASAANRRVHIRFDPDGSAAYECISGTNQIANETKKYTCYATSAGATLADDNDIIIPIPQIIQMNPGGAISTETTNLQAGDNYGQATIIFDRYFTKS